MSTQIDNSFVKQYEADAHDAFQRQGSKILNTVRHKPGVKGSSTTFQRIGTGTATTKARHGVITPMNQDHTAIECALSDFYAGDWVDKLDELKTNIDERGAVAKGGAWALGRKVDNIHRRARQQQQSNLAGQLLRHSHIEPCLLGVVYASLARL